jgi:hypothetical protein
MSPTYQSLARRATRLASVVVLGAATALGATACSDRLPTATLDSIRPTPPAPNVAAGNYVLLAVNGQALPYANGSVVWDAMTLVVGDDDSIAASLRWHETDAEGAIVDQGVDEALGVYALSGDQLTLIIDDDTPGTAVLDGATLTVRIGGDEFLFRRE